MSQPSHTHQLTTPRLHPGVSVADLAQVVHELTAPTGHDQVVVTSTTDDRLEVKIWPIPAGAPSPTDVLIGWRPRGPVGAVGLVVSGQEHSPVHLGRVGLTVMIDSQARAATVLERPEHQPELILETPQGWASDALHRTLGLATPPPDVPVSACVDASWLAQVAAVAWPPEVDGLPPLTWAQIAPLHPLAPAGPSSTPQALAALTTEMDRASGWSRLLHQAAASLPPSAIHPPGGRPVPLGAWFDQGSFSRWMLRQQPDVSDLFWDLLDQLTDEAASKLMDALVSL